MRHPPLRFNLFCLSHSNCGNSTSFSSLLFQFAAINYLLLRFSLCFPNKSYVFPSVIRKWFQGYFFTFFVFTAILKNCNIFGLNSKGHHIICILYVGCVDYVGSSDVCCVALAACFPFAANVTNSIMFCWKQKLVAKLLVRITIQASLEEDRERERRGARNLEISEINFADNLRLLFPLK